MHRLFSSIQCLFYTVSVLYIVLYKCHFPIILKFHFYEFFEQPEYNYFMYKIKGPLTVYGFKNFVNLFI